ncbi:hypothetical protein BDV06DRAFT_227940 [Aspergillus oleicola]
MKRYPAKDILALVTSNEPEKIYREYNYLRSHCPVAHVDKHNGYWVLTSDYIRQIVIIAMVAPTIMITAITKHLAEDKDLTNKLRTDRSLLPAAIEEFI